MRNLGMCPDWDLNLQPFGVQDDSPASQATQPGPNLHGILLLFTFF